MSFEQDVDRLDEIVSELGREDLDLERALALFQEGIERLRTANASLNALEAQVKVLVEKPDGTFALKELGG
ncbi:MAG TPA: exodeoxyribonuclease VII small subunit [Gemmatimonadaceae bacterium]|nr:exodeoxyribonuclease VII small subunit [Gemmatimonadaceae bacterium]